MITPNLARVPPIQAEPIASQVAEILRQWILTGHLAGGHHVRQEAIAEELGVSRVPVREALLMLEVEGLITRKKYKGAFVAEISLSEVQETYQLRDLLESFLFSKALPHIEESHLRHAENIIRQSMENITSDDWMRLNIQFHMTLYEPSQLTLTMQTLKGLLQRTDRYFRLQQAVSPSVQHASRYQHQRIIDVIRTGDHEAALQAMHQHIQSNADEIIQYIDKNKSDSRPELVPTTLASG
jgi:DNA-binding GntR family transcriptional regulator